MMWMTITLGDKGGGERRAPCRDVGFTIAFHLCLKVQVGVQLLHAPEIITPPSPCLDHPSQTSTNTLVNSQEGQEHRSVYKHF